MSRCVSVRLPAGITVPMLLIPYNAHLTDLRPIDQGKLIRGQSRPEYRTLVQLWPAQGKLAGQLAMPC